MTPLPVDPYEELEERLRFETLIADLSSKFVNLPTGEVDREIMDAERRICEVLGLDILALWQMSDEAPDFFTLTHYYSVQEGPQPPGRVKVEDLPWFLQQVLAGHIVAISSLEDLPPEAVRDRELCRQLGVKSNLTIPLSVGGQRPFGALGLNTTLAQRDWTDELVKRLQLLAQVFANALGPSIQGRLTHSPVSSLVGLQRNHEEYALQPRPSRVPGIASRSLSCGMRGKPTLENTYEASHHLQHAVANPRNARTRSLPSIRSVRQGGCAAGRAVRCRPANARLRPAAG